MKPTELGALLATTLFYEVLLESEETWTCSLCEHDGNSILLEICNQCKQEDPERVIP